MNHSHIFGESFSENSYIKFLHVLSKAPPRLILVVRPAIPFRKSTASRNKASLPEDDNEDIRVEFEAASASDRLAEGQY